jgi:hypothetical protein
LGKQVIDLLPLLMGEDRLLYPQSKIRLTPEIGGTDSLTGNDPLELLEQLMGILRATDHTAAGKPGGELLEMHLPSWGYMDALQVLLKREKIDLLVFIGITGGVVEIP